MESKKMADNSNSRIQLQLHNHNTQQQQQSNLTSNYNNMQMGLNNFDANQQLLGMYGHMGFINTNNNNINNNFNNHHQQQQQQQMGLSRMPRHKSEIQCGTQFGPGVNSAGQTLQAMGMINNNLNMNSHMRTNGNLTVSQQRFNLQLRQKILEQASLASIAAQGLQRTPYMNAHLSELAQNGQQAMPQSSVSQRQWSNQMPAMYTTNSHSYRVQQHRQPQTVPQHHLAASPQLPQNSMGLSPQQLAQIAQQQQQQKLLNQQPQSCPRVIVPTGQKSISLTGSQPDITASGGSSSQVTEASNLLLGKRKIQDLVSQVDPRGRLDPEVEDLLLELADDFIDSVTTFACSLAKHRKSTTLETKDVLLHLEKNWNLTVPGFSREERKNRHKPVSNELHKTHLDTIRALMEPSQSPINNGKEVARQGIINPDGVNHMMRPSLSSDQLVSQSNASQIVQKLYRF